MFYFSCCSLLSTLRKHQVSSSPPWAPAKQKPPPQEAIFFTYLVLGSIVSFGFGRDPAAKFPENLHAELAPTIVVVALFLMSYSVWDVMAVGLMKLNNNYSSHGTYNEMEVKMPEEVFLAWRAQSNQVEQMPVFLVGSLSCAFFVNGNVAAALSLIWVILRRLYARTYRKSVGVPFEKMGLGQFTIPAYFTVNTMLASAAIQAARIWWATKA